MLHPTALLLLVAAAGGAACQTAAGVLGGCLGLVVGERLAFDLQMILLWAVCLLLPWSGDPFVPPLAPCYHVC